MNKENAVVGKCFAGKGDSGLSRLTVPALFFGGVAVRFQFPRRECVYGSIPIIAIVHTDTRRTRGRIEGGIERDWGNGGRADLT